tara:strand:- start:471 stop:914 length:444 start_codon:yes stop_codon:yes gene_type:complete
MNKIISILLIGFFCSACNSQDYQCKQKEGNLSLSNGNYDAAFDQLKDCEDVDNVTDLTLGQLAVLYGHFGYGEFEGKKSRARKVYDLYIRSALKGNEDAISSILSMFESGEPLISLKPQKEKSACLRALLDSDAKYKSKQVSACLGK